MAGLVNLLEVVRFREVCVKELGQQRLSEIQELVLLVVRQDVRFVRLEVLGWDPVVINNSGIGPQPSNEELVKHAICGVGVVVLSGILHDFTDVLSSILEDEVVTPGMVWHEFRHVIDLPITSDPAALERGVLLDVLGGENANPFRERHRLHGCGEGGNRGCNRLKNICLIQRGATFTYVSLAWIRPRQEENGKGYQGFPPTASTVDRLSAVHLTSVVFSLMAASLPPAPVCLK